MKGFKRYAVGAGGMLVLGRSAAAEPTSVTRTRTRKGFLDMRRFLILTLLVAIAACALATSASAKPRGFNGKIVTNSDNLVTGTEQVYTVDPDGTSDQLLYDNSEVGHWSPDGTRVALVTQLDPPQVLLFNVDDGSSVYFGLPFDLYPDLALFCTVWSPDGTRLACEGQGQTDPNLNGIYTVRSSDGGDLQRVTSAPFGDDCPADYSPNGKRLLISNGALAVIHSDGNERQQITPQGMSVNFCSGSWSPQGNEIVFSARVPNPQDFHSSIWVVHSNGTGLRQLPIDGPCGGPFADPSAYGCFNPVWSPDGRKIVFGRNQDDGQRDLYTVNADGSGLFQVTDTPDISEFNGDWGTHPLTP
jgi:Tol biopolymer transport system component